MIAVYWLLGVLSLVAPRAAQEPSCSVLFMSDTHGPADKNVPLVHTTLEEEGIAAVLHGGDVADAADLYVPWFDTPFRSLTERWDFWAASGNHDAADAATKSAFASRFPALPAQLSCGNADIYLLPWAPNTENIEWLRDRVENSAARWRVLVIHKPVWPVDGGNARLRRELEPVLPRIDLVLSGHEHVSSDAAHVLGGSTIRQIIEVSGPKKYECPEDPDEPCTYGETAYWRIDFYADELRASRRVVSP